jgi:hypothetical protein
LIPGGLKPHHVTHPFVSGGRKVGVLRLGLVLPGPGNEGAKAKGEALWASLLIFAAGFLLAVGLSAHLTAPLREVVDVAAEVSAGKDLDLSRGQVEQVLGNLPADVMLFDSDGLFLYANRAAIEDPAERQWVMGKSPEEHVDHAGLTTTGK